MTQRTVITRNEDETITLAQQVADAVVAARSDRAGLIIGLSGDLGMGKSVFARAFIRHVLGDDALNVPSPTFTLVQYYDAPFGALYHYDLYRLEDPEEVYELGWEESLAEGVSLVEWPERLMGMKPPAMVDISIAQIHNSDERIFTLMGDFSL